MHAKIVAIVAVVAALSAVPQGAAPQDPEKRPAPPADAKPLPPVREPFRSAVERKDLLQQFGTPTPLAGVYELQSLQHPGVQAIEARGYLTVGRRYLSVQLVGMTPDMPALQAGFRRYRVDGSRLHMTNLLGFRAEPDETWGFDPEGATTSCEYQLIGTKLTLLLDNGDQLVFVRIE